MCRAWRVKARKQHRYDTGKKDAVERSGAADRGDRRAEAAHLVECILALRRFCGLASPKVLEPRRGQFGVAHGVLDVAVPEVGFKCPGVMSSVGERARSCMRAAACAGGL